MAFGMKKGNKTKKERTDRSMVKGQGKTKERRTWDGKGKARAGSGWRDMWKAALVTAMMTPLLVCMPVQSVGALLLLWGLFEWAQALNTQDGGSQSMAFKRVASGLVAIIAPQLIPLIRNAVAGGAG